MTKPAERPAEDLKDIETILRGAAAEGRPILALLDAWPALEAFARHDEEALFEVLQASAALSPSVGSAAELNPEQAAIAVAKEGARAVRADERFMRWVGDPLRSPALTKLLRAARGGRPGVTLVQSAAGVVFPVLATRVSANSKWREVIAATAGTAGEGDVLLIAFAPARSRTLVLRAGRTIGLSRIEAELAAVLIEEPTVEAAAYRLGLGVDAARQAMRRAVKRTGARNAADLIGRIVDLGSGLADRPFPEPHGADRLLGLSPAETRVARMLADGRTADETATLLKLTTETVKSYRRTIFAKLGLNRTRDLRRLMTETRALSSLDEAVEVQAAPADSGALRLFVDAAGRGVAAIDYGPPDGRPLLLFHGSTTGRLAAPPMLAELAARGYRVIVPQRPGFGLTSPARGAFAETAAADLVLLLDAMRVPAATLIARDGGVATAMAFAEAHPRRLERGLLLNPRRPREAVRTSASPMDALTAMLLRHPRLADPFARMITRQTREDVLERLLSGVYAPVEADRSCAAEPGVMRHLIADLRGLVGRTAEGFAAEHRLFADGWAPAEQFDPRPWTFVFSSALWPGDDLNAWRGLAAGRLAVIQRAGLLLQFTHAQAVADALEAI